MSPPPFLAEGVTACTGWGPESHSEASATGPVSLLLVALARAGIRVDASWNMYRSYARVTSLTQEPWQQVLSFLHDAHQKAQVIEATNARDSMAGTCSIDWALTMSHPKDWSRAKRGLIKAANCGALWTSHEAFKAGQVGDMSCPHCQSPRGDLLHTLWVCPAFEHLRVGARVALGRIDPLSLPKCLLLHGLMPTIPASYTDDLCLGQGDQRVSFHDQVQALTSTPLDPSWASQALVGELIRGPTPALETIEGLGPIDEPPPHLACVYTDGTVLWPTVPVCRLGGVGIHLVESIANSVGACTPPFPDFVDVTSGAGRKATVSGPWLSSSRTEAIALATAALLPEPITVATDSAVVVSKFGRLIARLARGGGGLAPSCCR